ncbi:hypothetical protein [Bacterioplanoides sp. SCSIO 12839]|uniref:hypothetical protein n=1 Tax=Bacterioplanoides sp. SCSIO 12839 TaxID=2829569 RepID=UPI00210319BB|nr:hypothetical protein [Bacterioplanoides sp. SCSIO 12839]UTW47424.1 hypothetical protein KFF03_12675 [Bacterioplanoides sp. SCSIO 12839]
MELKKNYLAVALMAATLVGCGSDSDNDDDDSGNGNGGTQPPVSTNYEVDCNADNSRCFVSGNIDEDFTMTADRQWVLDGSVFVGAGQVAITSAAQEQAIKDAGVTLTIEAGTDVRGLSNATLVITRGSKIMAEGTKADPITFSSAADDNFNGLGEWGGVIVQGFAPQYGAGNTGICSEGNADGICNVEGEGGLDETIRYGGDDAADNSGVIRYVRIAEGGRVAGPGNEVNGLTMQGVGHGTTVEYIQVHDNLDDGLEWFGGTVNVKYAVLTGNDDDSIDFDEGYQGNIQYAIVRMTADRNSPAGSNDPRGIEANSSDDEYVPQTQAALANITIVGNRDYSDEPGMRLRGALTASLYNTAVFNFDACARIDDAKDVDGQGTNVPSDVTFHNVQGSSTTCGEFYNKEEADTTSGTNELQSITLNAAAAVPGSVAQAEFAEVDNGSGFAFDNTTYIGAVDPAVAAADAWYAGWIIEGSLDDIADQANTAPAAQ